MRIVSLRAPAPGAMSIDLHPRLTLLVGTTTSDRLALQSVFRALVGADVSRLEVTLDLNGVEVRLDEAFSVTFLTQRTIDPVLVVGVPQGAIPAAVVATSQPAAVFEDARLDSLRVEQRNLSGELEVLERELDSERLARARGLRGEDPEVFGHGPPGAELVPARIETIVYPPWRPLVMALQEAVGAVRHTADESDPHELADRLEHLDSGEQADRERVAALEQLLAECRQALDGVRRPAQPPPSFDPLRLAAIEQVRDEMLTLATAQGRPGRRNRQRIEELRATEARLLAELGHPSYVSLLSALARTAGGAGEPPDSNQRAREAVLMELERFLLDRLSESVGGNDRHRLMSRAAALLGEPTRNLDSRSARLVAGRLRAVRPVSGDLTEAVRLASALERELKLEPSVVRTPEEVLEIARGQLESAPSMVHTTAVGGSRWHRDGGDRISQLERRRRDLTSRLQEVSEALAARERAASVLAEAPVGSVGGGAVDLRAGSAHHEEGLFGGSSAAGHSLSAAELAAAVQSARSVSLVGPMPLLLLESGRSAGSSSSDALPDPLNMAAMSAVTQLVWVSDRPEVAAAVEQLGELAGIIRV